MTEARPAAHPDTAQVAEAVVGAEEAELSYRAAAQAPAPAQRGRAGSFQSRLALVFTTMAIVPLLIFGALMVATGSVETGGDVRSLLIAATITFVIVIVGGFAAASRLTAPLRELAATVERVGTAAPAGPLPLPGDRAFARLDDGRERLAADIGRRDRELSEILNAAKSATPQEALERFAERAARGAAASFGLIDASIILGPPDEISALERSPGEPPTVRAEVHAGHERLGVFVGRLPAMRRWEPADQTLLDLFAREIGVAIRNAQLLAQVESQYGQLQRLGEAKDDFLRGVTHNLQTPLTNIRAQATQLAQAAVNGEP
ncbi:MAG: hypothetical protein ACRDQC_00290, partial [Gaiellales bacterium]